ncbi:helix-turn-helix transcriptional regulator [Streptomyces sp. NPDC056696]|uniref:helix-turn-helix transcriptional regulator n=1 Tax=Streptomyces sp. NPDC056696 TaxID=3345914 RepID=UPI00368FC1D7
MSSDLGIPLRQTAAPAASPSAHPADPAGLHAHLAALQGDLRRADASLSRLLSDWPPGQDGDAYVTVLEERAEQARRIYELEYGARTSLWVFQSGANTVAPVPTTLPDTSDTPDTPDTPEPSETSDAVAQEAEGSPLEEPMRKDGNPHAAYRVVVDRAFLYEPAALRALDLRLERGHQVRVVDQPLVKLVVADGERALVQLEPGRSMELGPPLVLLATELFEAVWRRSRPYLREDGDLSSTDRRILQLMLSGLTDAATAHQLGMSPRTVQRRVRALMDTAAVSSRMQLGWYAMRNNWV